MAEPKVVAQAMVWECADGLDLLLGLPLFITVNANDFTLGIPLLDKFLFGALFVIYALSLALAEKAFDHYLPRKPTATKTDIPASSP